MNSVLQRIFGVRKHTPLPVAGLPLADIKRCMREALQDCSSVSAARLLHNINAARTPQDLWALRSNLHQCIAKTHTESVAAQRINALSSVFIGWVPAEQLVKVQPDFRPSQK